MPGKLLRKPDKRCAGCGSCTVVCPVFRATGNEALSARGKRRLLESSLSDKPSPVFKDIFAKCLLCGACESVCPRELPLISDFVESRAAFSGIYGHHGIRKVFADELLLHPSLLTGLLKAASGVAKLAAIPSWSGLRQKLPILQDIVNREKAQAGESEPSTTNSMASVFLFTGCYARYLQPSIISSLNTLLGYQEEKASCIPSAQRCCGLATFSRGGVGRARGLAKENIVAFEGSANPIIVGCASCYSHLKSYPALLREDGIWHERALAFRDRLRSFEQFFTPLISSDVHRAPSFQRILHHLSCHQRFHDDQAAFPRELYARINNTTYLGETDKCCGFGGLFQLGYPDISRSIFERGYEVVKQLEPTVVLTSCSGCHIWWSMELARLKSPCTCLHPASLLASCLPDEH